VSDEGIQTIKTLKAAHKMKNYIQIYFRSQKEEL
jgi:hypothetical protein